MIAGLTVRRATPADKDAVVAMCLAVNPDDFLPHIFDWVVAAEPPQGLYVAELDGRIVGCHALDVTGPDTGFFFGMRIDPRLQGQGIGSAYAAMQVEQAVAAGVRHLFLTSAPENVRAHRTVEKHGFVNRGGWVVCEGIDPAAFAPAGRAARAATDADLPLVSAFVAAATDEELAMVVPAPDFPYGFSILADEDLAVADLVVVEGAAGLEGVMLLRQADLDGGPELYVRWLEGTAEAAGALLDYARSWGGARGLTKWCLSFPVRNEGLYAPLGLDPAKCERWYMFEYKAP